MSEFKGTKWSLGGISGRMIKTNQYGGFVADVDIKKNALLISKAPEMLEMLEKCERSLREIYECDTKEIQQLIKEATEL